VLTVDAACAITVDPESASATPAVGTRPAPAPSSSKSPRRSGCCAAQSTPGSSIAMTVLVLAIVLRRRGR
jgi:uncharacterized protein (TIGR03382 family)